MRTAILVVVLAAFAAWAQATCLVAPPASPPAPTRLIINVSPDGGANQPLGDGGFALCSFFAEVPGGARPYVYGTTVAKCNIANAMAFQAAAIDNGWNDGGAP